MAEPRPFKIVFLGDTGVGKSSLFYRLVFNKFNQDYRPTTGTDFLSKSFYVRDTVCNVQLWDTSGQAKYWCLTEMFWRTADAAILVYDVCNEMLGNQLDIQADEQLQKQKQVKYETAQQWCKDNKVKLFYEVSAKESTNLKESIVKLLETLLLDQSNIDENSQDNETIESPLLQSSRNINQLTPMPMSPPSKSSPTCQDTVINQNV
ncbi:Rab GTPase [Heterostelium album PN500]|uniref:Rab GTPase n=1 Tax=Heterostelium pallidum (strain ATCC 26659 / Pp 5 / PN500) TaxID=670386 RepID=D3BKA4_HETP5|nr:Rab GTPase [Heterostelium album PN500]EFA78334.1 Rab GTPase [Heterostelium album PN500]|eukprot:XP_020430459.1 Rab GTPase [Heterostelium album PN500]